MFLFVDKFQAKYIQAWLVEHPLILGLYAIFIGIVVVSLFILFGIFMKKIINPLWEEEQKEKLRREEEEEKQKKEKEAERKAIIKSYKEKILQLLQSNQYETFSEYNIQKILRLENFRLVDFALKELFEENKIGKIIYLHKVVEFFYKDTPI